MKGFIYKYTNLINGFAYIGATTNPSNRYRQHKNGSHKGTAFYNAVKEFGFDNFKYEVLAVLDFDDKSVLRQKLAFLERFYIRKYKTFSERGYNATAGGPGALGTHGSDLQKSNASAYMKENNPAFNYTDEWRKHIADSQRGKKMSDSFRQVTAERMRANNPMKNPGVVARVMAARKASALKKNSAKHD